MQLLDIGEPHPHPHSLREVKDRRVLLTPRMKVFLVKLNHLVSLLIIIEGGYVELIKIFGTKTETVILVTSLRAKQPH